MTLPTDLRAWWLANSDLTDVCGTRIHQNRAPETYAGAYLWFARRGLDREDTLGMPAGDAPFRQQFDVEAISKDGDEADALADAILALHAYRGALNSGSVQAIFVANRTDDYVPRGLMADEALEYAALELEVVGYTT